MRGRYDDILNIGRVYSAKHPPIPRSVRAAQFAPYAALTGYGNVIDEAARSTDTAPELADGAVAELDEALRYLYECIDRHPEVTLRWFRPDSRKPGGAVVTVRARAEKLDAFARILLLGSGERIPLDAILSLRVE